MRDLGARGVQIFSNVAGLPLDRDEFRFLFEAMADYAPRRSLSFSVSAAASGLQNFLELTDGAAAFPNGAQPELMAVKLGVGEGNASERLSDHVRWSGFAIGPEKESRSGVDIGMSPTVQDHAGDRIYRRPSE